MFWWFDPSKQRVFCTHPFASRFPNDGFIHHWPNMQPKIWTPWFGAM